MANEMTVRDFYEECVNFEYSQEYFESMKECAELELQQRYLLNEAHQIFGECGSEEYLVEAAKKDPEKTSNFISNVKDFGTKVWKTLVKAWQWLIKKATQLRNFVKKLMSKAENKQIYTTIDILKKCNLTKEDASKLVKIASDSYVAMSNSEATKSLSVTFDPYLNKDNTTGINFPAMRKQSKNLLLTALAVDTVTVGLRRIEGRSKSLFYTYSVDELFDYIVSETKLIKQGQYEEASKVGVKLNATTRVKEMTISLSRDKLQKFIDKLENAKTSLEDAIKVISDQSDVSGAVNTTVYQLQSIYKPAIECISEYIAITTNFMSWRQDVAPKLLEAAKEIQAAQKEAAAAKPDEESNNTETEEPMGEGVNYSDLNVLNAFIFG